MRARHLFLVVAFGACGRSADVSPNAKDAEVVAPAVTNPIAAAPDASVGATPPAVAKAPDLTSPLAGRAPDVARAQEVYVAPTPEEDDAIIAANERAYRDQVAELAKASPTAKHVAPKKDAGACALVLDEATGAFMVGGKPVFFPIKDMSRVTAAEVERVAVSWGRAKDGLLYVGFGDPWDWNASGASYADWAGPASDILWAVDCKNPTGRPSRFIRIAGANFGHSALSPDGSWLAYASTSGLMRLDLGDKHSELVMSPPPIDPKIAPMSAQPEGAVQYVLPDAWSDDGLRVLMGGPFGGGHGDYTVESWLITTVGHVEPWQLVRATEVKALARGSDGRLWLAFAGSSSLVYSDDNGDSWASVSVPALPQGSEWSAMTERSVADILVDAKDPTRLAVCLVATGEVFISTDSGKHWSAVDIPEEDIDASRIERVWSPNASLGRLRIGVKRWRDPDFQDASAAAATGTEWTTFESADLGKTWKKVERAEPPNASPRLALPDGTVFTASLRGLWRAPKGGPRTLVFPGPNGPPPPVWGRPMEPAVARTPMTWADLDRANAANTRGLGLLKRGLFDDAIAAFTEAWTIAPDHALSRYNAACAEARAGRPDKALVQLEELTRRRGYMGLTLLANARLDKDLASLATNKRFLTLTMSGAPASAFDQTSPWDDHPRDYSLSFASDRAERLCLHGGTGLPITDEDGKEGPGSEVHRFDCATGKPFGEPVVGSIADIDRLVNDLGMVEWSPIADDAPERAAVLAWVKQVSSSKDAADFTLYRSPSGKLVAARGDELDGLVIGPFPNVPEAGGH